jgi:uncharacterized protein (TIGR02246 family)
MNQQQSGLEWIKKLPTWINATIALVMGIIGFIIFIQKNYQLGIVVISALFLAAIFFLCLYIVFAKTPPLLEEGKGLYRYEKYRLPAKVGLVIVTIGAVLIFVFNPSRSFVFAAFTGVSLSSNIPDCNTVLGIAPTSTASSSDDETQIKQLIETEAEAILDQNANDVMGIFREDTIIRSGSSQEWNGCEAIKDRYKRLIETYTFTSLRHELIRLDIKGNTATAKTVVETEYLLRNPADEYMAQVSGLTKSLPVNQSGESWRFKKDNGVWKVTLFVYGLPP